jgi:hypothetical protein
MYIVNAVKPVLDTVHIVWASSVKSPAYVESICANPELATNRSPMAINNALFILATSFNPKPVLITLPGVRGHATCRATLLMGDTVL